MSVTGSPASPGRSPIEPGGLFEQLPNNEYLQDVTQLAKGRKVPASKLFRGPAQQRSGDAGVQYAHVGNRGGA